MGVVVVADVQQHVESTAAALHAGPVRCGHLVLLRRPQRHPSVPAAEVAGAGALHEERGVRRYVGLPLRRYCGRVYGSSGGAGRGETATNANHPFEFKGLITRRADLHILNKFVAIQVLDVTAI